MNPQHDRDIRQWLTALSTRCAPRTTENLEILTRDYAVGLADLPYEAFTPQSREAASRQWEYFPSYKSLRKFLETWVEKNATTNMKRLPPIADPSLSEQDQAHVRSWINLRAERIAAGRLTIGLSLLRKWPRAFDYVCRTDAEAHDIARRRGWLGEDNSPEAIDKRMQDDWGSITEAGLTGKLIALEQLHRAGRQGPKIAASCLSFLRLAISKHVPHLAHLIPDRFTDAEAETQRTPDEQMAALGDALDAVDAVRVAAAAAFEAKHGRAPGTLSDDALAAARSASQAVQKARAHQEVVRQRDAWTPPWEA
jgi:hypothetical protein